LEGFAFGLQVAFPQPGSDNIKNNKIKLQKTLANAVTLFFGITVHKAIVFFSIGTRLVMANPSKWRLTALAIFFLALCSPIGAVIGIALQVRIVMF
jgi:zinc transporter ZupT